MKHKFQSAKTDGADSTLVRPSNWNDVHVAGTTDISANTTLDATHDSVYVTTAASTIVVTLPAAPTEGQRYEILKADAGTGSVDITGGTINGQPHFYLIEQYQYVTLEYHGTAWCIKAQN